jgi:tetratricopeptide (TPR) repeat protein
VRKLYALVAACRRELGQPDRAVEACRAGRAHYPDDAELLYLEALLHQERADLTAAEECLATLLQTQPAAHFASVDASLRDFKGRHQLAAVYFQQGRLAEAEALWRQVVHEQPGFRPAWQGLHKVYQATGRHDLAAEAVGYSAR